MNIIPFFSSWLKDIVVLFILITIAELIIPKGNMKKYINLIIGLLIIFTIISPLVKLVKSDFDFDKTVMNYSKYNEIDDSEIQEFYAQQEEQIEEVFKERIRKEITQEIEHASDYKVVNMIVDIGSGDGNYGQISNLEIILDNSNSDMEEKIVIEKVEKVDLKNSKEEKEILNEDFEEIKDLIFNKFLVEKDRIRIKRKKDR